MGSEIETTEQRVKSFIVQLQTECGILERIVYKNKNQHRRCSYFQYLLKVRRDLKLLKSANMEEILNACFLIINGNRPKQKVQLLESLKRKRCDSGKYNVLERLLGVARLLSQMVEPMMKAAMEVSKLLARSFFMGFSVTILAVLARLRVLVQQILLDVVHVFNTVSSLSQKEQTIKLNQRGFEVFREYYPAKEQANTFLECVWQTDKYLLVERTNTSESESQEKGIVEDVSLRSSKILYENIEVLLGVDNPGTLDSEHVSEEGPTQEVNTRSLVNGDEKQAEVASGTPGPSSGNTVSLEEPSTRIERNSNISSPVKVAKINHEKKRVESDSNDTLFSSEAALPTSSTASLSPCPVKVKTATKKVAFVSIKRSVPSPSDQSGFNGERTEKNDRYKEDSFFNLLSAGNQNNSLF
ncbi:Hypothetical predicted protein [Olea europaea subsp. europaea]|uniref:Nucleolus and neural progenitor protein-like N-terminal domain-containing protein n=1 Tax=Olea europaea subsp. europaea TaxID=158383 RepID=A0A8S0THN6_OLEEU|nr:Hypothetical predicted protein [Olea europaea subsp. europaea]